MANIHTDDSIWVSVKVWRGFPDKIVGFKTEELAIRQTELWQKQGNPDYDETGVFKLSISENIIEDDDC